MKIVDLKYKLSAPFNAEEWKSILMEMFPKVEYFTQAKEVTHESVKSGGQIGLIRLDNDRSLALYVFEVVDKILIGRNRKGLRDIVAPGIDQAIIHGALAFYYSKNVADYRLTYIAKQSTFNDYGELIKTETAPKRYTFLLGKNESCRTASERLFELICKRTNGSVYLSDVTEAFSVERLNKEFFTGYKAQYAKFLKDLPDRKEIRDYVKKLLGRLVFLQFLQKKGWMGVPASNASWIGGDKNYLSHLIARYEGNNRLLSDVLEKLFFETLNEKRNGDLADMLLGEHIRIPYLNGGLFEKDDIDRQDIDFPYAYFKELMDFFDMYNFTIDENDPEDSEVGIDPEMLGHIFENLLEDNKDKGAFYTPKEIVQYMCRQCVIQYLKTHLPDEQFVQPIEQLINSDKVPLILQTKKTAFRLLQLLKEVKVCDPAIGSGAFPMGIFYVLYHAIRHLQSFAEPNKSFDSIQTKCDIIQNNIFGVDIEQGAVDIARLRFWLALVVDSDEPKPLPNLDYKITRGNSILHRFALDTPFDNVFIEYNKDKSDVEKMSLSKYKQMVYEFTETSDHDKKNEFRAIIEQVKNAFRTNLPDVGLNDIRNIQKKIVKLESPMLFGERTDSEKLKINKLKKQLAQAIKDFEEINKSKIYDHSFEWRFEFPALLNDKGDFVGFDIIIGNPPYGAKLSTLEKNIFKNYYSDVHMRTPETFCYFISQAFRLLHPQGVVSYIVPNNMFFQNENEKTRSLLLFKHQLVRAINLGDNTFENADVPTCIFVARGENKDNYDVAYSDYRQFNIHDIEWDEDYENVSTDLTKTVPAFVLGLSVADIKIINKIRDHGILIDSIAAEMASGISTGGDKIFRISAEYAKDLNLERDILHKVLVGAEINSYCIEKKDNVIIYTTKDVDINSHTNILNYLFAFQKKLSGKRETVKGMLPWWCLHWPRYKLLFEEPKIIMRQTSDSIRCVYDEAGFYVLDSILVLKTNTLQYAYKYIAVVLNSTLEDYIYKKLTQEEGRTFAQVKPVNVRKLYIPQATAEEQELLSVLYDYMAFLKSPQQAAMPLVEDLFAQIIDGCVYELFFREHMQERGIDIMSYLYSKIKPIAGLSMQVSNEVIGSVFNDIYTTDNQIRARLKLFVSRSPEFLKPIIQH